MTSTPTNLNPQANPSHPVSVYNFAPTANGSILATNVSQSIAIGGYGNTFQFQNAGTAEVFVEVGGASVVAVAGGAITAASDGSLAIQPGYCVVYDYPGLALPLYVAAVTASGSSLVRVSRGRGS